MNDPTHFIYLFFQTACPPNEFWCPESSPDNPVCVSELQYCDGVLNCPEGSDESEEICVTPPGGCMTLLV